MDAALLERIDAVRGATTRTKWIEDTCAGRLSHGESPAVRTASSVVAKAEPVDDGPPTSRLIECSHPRAKREIKNGGVKVCGACGKINP